LGILLVVTVLPAFNQLANSQLNTDLLKEPKLLWAQVGLLLFISIAAGIYPAVFLTRFKSSDVFRNILKAGKDSWIRKSLITAQFALSILLIISVIVVNKQLQYVTTKDLGFNKDRVVVLKLANTALENKSRAFSNALKQNYSITKITVSNRVPGQEFNQYGIIPEGYLEGDHLMASVLETDTDFPMAFDIKMKEGRYFSPALPTDTTESIVINEAMMRYLNWTSATGKKFEISGERKGRVIGVIKRY
jgi:putative ABC transport system permease protein